MGTSGEYLTSPKDHGPHGRRLIRNLIYQYFPRSIHGSCNDGNIILKRGDLLSVRKGWLFSAYLTYQPF